MRRANTQLQSDRRAEILAAAARCFVRSGFHQASMQEICAEAGMSPGNLYRYFPSKEAIIAGIAERDRADATADFAELERAPDFFPAFKALAQQYLAERPAEEVALCAEIMAESRRNPAVARIYQGIEAEVKQLFVNVLRHAADRGEIARGVDLEAATAVLMALGDGVSWRRAVDPDFDVRSAMPMILQMVRCMLTGGTAGGADAEEPPK